MRTDPSGGGRPSPLDQLARAALAGKLPAETARQYIMEHGPAWAKLRLHRGMPVELLVVALARGAPDPAKWRGIHVTPHRDGSVSVRIEYGEEP